MDLTTIVQQHKFLEYAGTHWGTHARTIQREKLQTDVVEFLLNNNYLRFTAMITLGKFDYRKVYVCDRSDVSAMHICAHFGLNQVTQGLIQQGQDFNCKDSHLWTPLFYAAIEGHTEIVKLLLAQPGIEVNAKDRLGNTPLSTAARRGHTAIVELLLAEPGIKLNARAPLSAAAGGGHTETVELLLAQ